MIFLFQPDGWLLDWLKQGLTPGVFLAFCAVAVGTWTAAMTYIRFRGFEEALAGIRATMVTKSDLQLTVQEMEGRLQRWADGRFLDDRHLETVRDAAKHQQDEIDEIRHHLFEILGKGTLGKGT